MSWAERTRQGIERWFTSKPSPDKPSWGERIGGWVASAFMGGVLKTMDYFEPDLREELKVPVKRLTDIPNLPPDLKNILDRALTEPKAIQLAVLLPFLIGMVFGFAMGVIAPVQRVGSYIIDKLIRSARLDAQTATHAYFRGLITEDKLKSALADQGFSDDDIVTWQGVLKLRLEPASVITAWRRDPEKYEKLFKDLKDQGWSEERIEAFKFVTLFYPSPEDLVNWIAKEVFEPDMIEKYGLTDEFERLDLSMFAKAGVTEEQAKNFWMAHWQHASWGQVLDMYHRGAITKDDMWEWFRVVEIPPFWRDKLIEISWSLPNRIETRMMARYGLVDKNWLVEHLERIGLHEDYRSIAADFMLAMGIRMDLSSRYSKGWLTSDEVKSEIADYGLSEDVGDRLHKWIVKNVEGDRVEGEKDITKTDILNGVKKGIITWEEGRELLQDMGYDELEADYLLEIKVGSLEETPEIVKKRDLTKTDILNAIKKEVLSVEDGRRMLIDLGYSEGEVDILIMIKLGVSTLSELDATIIGASPATFLDFKARTQRYQKLLGKEVKMPTPELRQAEKALREAEEALKAEEEKGTKNEKLAPFLKAVSDAQYKYRQLLAAYHQKS